jgi:acyl carrier protein
MTQDTSQIKTIVKDYIVEHFLRNKQIHDITDTTPLMSERLIDSISTIQLISYLEEKFNIEFEAHEVDKDNFENIAIIADFVSKKL